MCVAIPVLLAAASTAVSAYGAYNQSKAQQQALNQQAQVQANNAKLAEFAAQDAEAQGQREAAAARRATSQQRGSARVALAANGLELNAGTPMSLLDDIDYFGQVDQANISNSTAKNAWQIRNRAAIAENDAATLRNSASQINPGMSLASTLITGGSKVADKWYSSRSGA